MPYLAWRIPFLSTLNFNANTLRWPPYSSSCFDIILHFLRVCWFIISWVNQKRRSVCATVHYCALNLLTVPLKCGAIEHCVAPVLCRFLGHQQTWKRESWSPGPGWVGEERRVELGVPLKPPLQIRGAERGSKWLVLCGWCETLKS